jgi:hypothetical protein
MNDNVVLDVSIHDMHNLNVISSTKINQKVTQILRIFGVLPPVSSAQKESKDDQPTLADARKTCTVVIIRAKAKVASKLISIVEILKRDLSRRAVESSDRPPQEKEKATDADKAPALDASSKKTPILRLYQYTTVTTIPTEVKIKPPQPKSTQPPSTTASAPEEAQQQGTKRKRPIDSSQDSTTAAVTRTRTNKKQKSDDSAPPAKEQDEEVQHDDKPETISPEEDEADDFEVMAKIPVAGISDKDTGAQAVPDAPATAQMRDIPLLTVYLCSAPVASLDAAYGEQVG